jgi:ribose-phosphate pyrophosphokinase
VNKKGNSERKLSVMIHSFPDSSGLGRGLARSLGVGSASIDIHRFPDGETLVRVKPTLGNLAVLVQSLHDPDAKLISTLLASDALRRCGAKKVVLVAPYLPYMRQDAVFHTGEPISQSVIAGLLGRSFDHIVTIEPHLHRTHQLSDVFACSTHAVSAAPILARWIQRSGRGSLIVGPDEESAPWIRAIAESAKLPWVVGHKERLGDRRVHIKFPALPKCSRAVIVDDIASSGGTLAVAARALQRAGISSIDAAVVHAIFAPRALTRIRAAGIRTLVSCDTIPHKTNTVRSLPLLTSALQDLLR